MAAAFDFAQFCSENNLNEKTQSVLTKQDINTLDVLKELSTEDIKSLGLTIGQRTLFVKAIKQLKIPLSDKSIPNTGVVNTKDLSKDKSLNDLLKDIGENDLLVPTTSRDPVAELRSSGKPLLIPDFVTNPTYGSIQGSESELGTHGDSKLVIRGGKAKPRPETITLAQWISANSRILSKMIADGNTDSNKILQYLEYCEKFGDFAQTCEVESVMVYDNEYRKWQYDKSAEWGQDNTHLTLYYLRRKALPSRRDNNQMSFNTRGRTANNKPPRVLDSQGNEICFNYQSESGCQRRYCKFSHVCIIPGCGKSHPKYLHHNLQSPTQ